MFQSRISPCRGHLTTISRASGMRADRRGADRRDLEAAIRDMMREGEPGTEDREAAARDRFQAAEDRRAVRKDRERADDEAGEGGV
jgi:hypothetical protein